MFKKFGVIAILLFAFSARADILYGDIDHDGDVDNADAQLLTRMSLGQLPIGDLTLVELDLHPDGVFNRADATILLYYVLHRVPYLPY